MAALPRPSRPSLNNPPPSGPLPSIPKSRQSSVASIDRPGSGASSPATGSSLPQRLALNRTPSSSSASSIPSASQTSLPLASQTPNAQALQGRGLRKTISYNSFPRPPPVARTPSGNSPTSSNNTTPRSSIRSSSLFNGVPTRTTSLAATTTVSGAADASPTIDENAVADDDESVIDDSPRGRQRPNSSGKDKGNVIISVRVRPEKDSNETSAEAGEWLVEGKKSLVSYRGKEGGEYYYDNVFTTHDKNAKVYDSAAKRLVRRVMEGYNGTVFAYGMTGTGKTFSMQGTATSPGVIPLAITDIFSYIRETPHREFLLRVSYLEIYNEKIFDLLSAPAGAAPGEQQKEDIKLREDNKGNVYATPLKEEIVQSPTQLLRVISRGDHHRRTHSTQFNARSSRSHAVVQIVVESRERNAGVNSTKGENKRAPIIPGGVRVSTLSLIDLAGSERAAESKERRTEGAHINKSLLTLGTVISKLSGNRDKQGQPTDKDGKHLPYRDSKLTRLLQPALSGNSLISILCTLQLGSTGSAAAAGHHTIETLNTLKFAARARNNIVSHAKKAEEAHSNIGDAGSRALLDRYRVEILELRKQLEHQKSEADKSKDEQEEKAKEAEEQQRHEEQMLEMQLARTALKERIEHLNRLILSSKSIGVNTGRSYSSLNLAQSRGSIFSSMTDGGGGYAKSVRSSASTQNFDPYAHEHGARTSTGSLATINNGMNFDEEEDNLGENGDGTATLHAQIRNLQADLSDKNRYIQTLEKRLLQARRSSRSRVSMTFANRGSVLAAEEGGLDTLLREKDTEIAELREKLDDKDRMVAALRSAARKRDTADTNITSSSNLPGSDAANSSPASGGAERTDTPRDSVDDRRRSTDGYRNSIISPSSMSKQTRRNSLGPATVHPSAPSPANLLQSSRVASNRPTSPKSPGRKNHGVDEMTRMLDDMIRQKMENESNGADRTSRGLGYSNSLLNGTNVSPLTSARSGKRNTTKRMSTDGNRLSGWEPTASRRRSSLIEHQTPKSSTERTGSMLSQSHTNGISSASTSRPSTAMQSQTPTRSQNQYVNSTVAASQAIEALRPNALKQREYDDTSPSDSSTPTPENRESAVTYADTYMTNMGTNGVTGRPSMDRTAAVTANSL